MPVAVSLCIAGNLSCRACVHQILPENSFKPPVWAETSVLESKSLLLNVMWLVIAVPTFNNQLDSRASALCTALNLKKLVSQKWIWGQAQR